MIGAQKVNDVTKSDREGSEFRAPEDNGHSTPAETQNGVVAKDEQAKEANNREPGSESDVTNHVPKIEGQKKETNGLNQTIEAAHRISIIKEELKQPLGFVGYARVLQLLEEMRDIRGSEDLDSLLLLAECELHLGRGKQNQVLRKMTEFIRSPEGPNLDEVLRNSMDLTTDKRPLAALILRILWCELYDCSGQTADGAVEWIANNVGEIAAMTVPFVAAGARYRGIAIEFSLKRMEAMVEMLRQKKDLDTHRAIYEAKCLLNLVQLHHATKMYSKVISVGLEGIRILSLKLAGQAKNYCAYGMLLNSVGMAFGCSGKPEEAEVYFVQAKEACSAAIDFGDQRLRAEEINRAAVGAAVAGETFQGPHVDLEMDS